MNDLHAGTSIRAAAESDLPAIEALLTANQLPTSGVKEALNGFLVAECDGHIVGVVGMEHTREHALLRSTAVAPEWRGRGIARQLVERIIAESEARGIHALYLLTTTAERYFPSFGFQVTTRETVPDDIRNTGEFQTCCRDSATVMKLSLEEPAHRTES